MRRYYSHLRLFVCYLLCALFLGYSFFGAYNIKPKTRPTFTDILTKNEQNEAQNTINSEENTVSEEKISSEEGESTKKEESSTPQKSENSSLQVTASAVKGKVVTRYISPYSAPQSFGGVYLRNICGQSVDIKSLINKNLSFKIQKNTGPQVLIVHTHATESFMEKDEKYYTDEFKPRTTDNTKNMAKIGDVIAEKLNKNGIKTLHDKTHHDHPEYTGSYGRAAKTIGEYLKKYPSIKVVLDLHRDAVSADGGKAKLVTEIGGKKAAQVMLVMGSQTGSITGHPNWKENLSLAFKLHQTIEAKYPTLARPIMLASKKYNQHLTKGSLLIEFGTEVNTLDEACYSAELVGDSLVSLFNTLK